MNKKRINFLLGKSREVIQDAALENGAVLAANTEQPYYPPRAKNYHFVWPRDASFTCVAANVLGMSEIASRFFDWLTERPEDFKKEGTLYQRFAPNGKMAGDQFQPDQTGSVLWAIFEHYRLDLVKSREHEVLIRRLADGLCDAWQGKCFFKNTVDLWEESHRKTSTEMENNFTYSLAACAQGLRLADRMLHCRKWTEVGDQMIERINLAYDQKRRYFLRNFGKVSDSNIDASLLGLVYPFEIVGPDDKRMIKTVRKIEEVLVEFGGVHRYQFDYYDGEGTAQEGAGAWPLLNCWMAIVQQRMGRKRKARAYYRWVLEKTGSDGYIPEQVFTDFRQGIKPLVWSHAMFVLATSELGLL